MKVGIDMGQVSSGQVSGVAPGASALLDLEELLATRLLVQGNSGSGKSHLLRRLLEQSASMVQQAVIDPEGDFVTLADKFGHVVVDAARSEGDIQRIAARVRQHRVSVVLSLEGLDAEAQMRCAAAFLGGLFDADRDFWYPMLVVVDEAQLFAPAAAGEVSDEARKVSLGAMTNLMCRGRKRGLAGIIATQRLAKLAKNVAAEASNFLMGRTFLDIDMARAADLLGMERRQAEMFRDLERGHFVALGPALSRRPVPIRIGHVETAARSGNFTLMPLPEQPKEDARDLIFKAGEDEVAARPVMPRRAPPPPPAPSTNDLLAQLARTRAAATPEPQATEVTEETKAEREAALDQILREILDDPEAAFRSVAVLYQDFLVRCRIRRVSGEPLNLNAFRRRLAVARAGVDTAMAEGSEWDRAVAFANALEEDIQGVYLLLARAAMEGSPCPPDGEIARACGSRSPGRARRLVAYMEGRNIVVTRNDPRGLRVIALPDLGWETGPGDPNAFEEPPAASGGQDQLSLV
ncbi:helicase HerA domain-containing protein [Microvirga rosea]|uniref:helicase HerA domain-containing protein n=1 Tax=Microvirga rosea TaxID=2715425 RepID=UPI001D0B0312|nr:ATP-binding protein [Microvirga rosea]MCB8819368.1 ATP-binding protein [Microvirga rosea]